MRHSEFWTRMREQFGTAYAESVSRDQVITRLEGRTAVQALADGEDPKRVWLAVCEHFDIPVPQRH